jgi:hypothetical protein
LEDPPKNNLKLPASTLSLKREREKHTFLEREREKQQTRKFVNFEVFFYMEILVLLWSLIPTNFPVWIWCVTACFSIAVIPKHKLSLSLSLSLFFYHLHWRKRIIIRGTPEENLWFLRRFWFWVRDWLIWVLWVLWKLEANFGDTRVVVLPWLGIDILNLGLLLMEVGPTIWNQGDSIKFGGEAMSVLFVFVVISS